MDGVEGFEPPISVPKTEALPLGDTPMCLLKLLKIMLVAEVGFEPTTFGL